MIRSVLVALALGACGRAQGVADQDLGGLVVTPKAKTDPIDLAAAAKDPAELGRALAEPYHAVLAALGPHVVTLASETAVSENGKQVSDLTDQTTLEPGDKGTFHAVYTNSADYGREVVFADGQLYLRPRYQKWHQRAPEAPDEPEKLRDSFYEPIAATWDLLAPGVALADGGAAQIAGRAGRKIVIKRAASPAPPPAEPLVQRKWREHRSVDAVAGEIVLDAERGVPLAVHLTGTVGFTRDGRRFAMAVKLDADVSALGQLAAITVPAGDDVVATPERMREVDERDYLLQGIAPPLRKAADGAAAPAAKPATTAPPAADHADQAAAKKPAAKADPASDSKR